MLPSEAGDVLGTAMELQRAIKPILIFVTVHLWLWLCFPSFFLLKKISVSKKGQITGLEQTQWFLHCQPCQRAMTSGFICFIPIEQKRHLSIEVVSGSGDVRPELVTRNSGIRDRVKKIIDHDHGIRDRQAESQKTMV